MELDKLDKKIISLLQSNSRLSYRNMAKKAKVSVATVMHRMNKLKQSGAMKGFTVDMDYEQLGYEFHAIINLRVSKGKLLQVERKIATHPNVYAVYDTTGHFDATIITRFKSRRTMDNFIKRVQTYEFVERTETRLVLNTIKEEGIRL